MKVATVTCVVVKAAPGSALVAGSRLTCDVNLRCTKDGLAWSVLHRGETRTLESGTIPLAQLKPARTGHLRVVVDRVATPFAAASPGEQRYTLYQKSDCDYPGALVPAPNPASNPPVRTELLVAPEGALALHGQPATREATPTPVPPPPASLCQADIQV